MPCSIASVHRCRLGVLETCLRLSLRVILVILVIGDLPGESNERSRMKEEIVSP